MGCPFLTLLICLVGKATSASEGLLLSKIHFWEWDTQPRYQPLDCPFILSQIPHYNPFISSMSEPLSTDLPQATRQRTGETEAVGIAVGLLQDEFELRRAALETFSPKATRPHIRTSISVYEDQMSATSKGSVCCCGMFRPTADIYQVED